MGSTARTPKQAGVVSRLMHVIVKWSPGKGFEKETIAAHARVLRAAPPSKTYVWFGKFSKSGGAGLSRATMAEFRRQLAGAAESHLYLYCPDKIRPSLHVGLVAAAQTTHPREPGAMPEYYSTLPYPVTSWFRLTDIREVSLEALDNLTISNGQAFDPVSSQFYPLAVYERRPLTLFNYSETNGTKWFQLQSLDTPNAAPANIKPKLVFVVMPFEAGFHDAYHLGIKPTVEELGFECKRADDFLGSSAESVDCRRIG